MPADGDGIAKLTTSDTDVTVTFNGEHHDNLVQTMQAIWTPSRQVERKDWVQSDDATTTVVTLFGGAVVKAVADKSTTATTRPKETCNRKASNPAKHPTI